MRVHHFLVVGVLAAAVAVLLVAPGAAAPGLNVSVKITNTNCVVGYKVVSHTYSTIVFGVFNNGSVVHGFDIGGKYKSGLIKPHQEKTIIAHFGAGGYRWACVAAHSTVKKGVLTIR